MSYKILLSDGLSFVLSRDLIQKVGLEEALILQKIHYWVDPKRNQNIFQGKHWVHNTYKQWQKQFSFWSLKKIQRIFNVLEEQELLLSFTQYTGWHKTKYYTFNHERLYQVRETAEPSSCPQNGTIVSPKMIDRKDKIGCKYAPKTVHSYKPIAEITNRDNPLLSPPRNLSTAYRQEEEEKSKKDKTKQASPINFRERVLFQQMMDAWNELVLKLSGSGPLAFLSPSRLEKFRHFIAQTSISELESWKNYCQKIRQSRFLMGDNSPGFRATLDWALNPDNACKVLEGAIFDKPRENASGVLGAWAEKSWPEYTSFLKQHCMENGYSDQWFEACKVLTTLLGQATFESWFKRMAPKEKSRGALYLMVENTFFQDYIKTYHEDALKKAVLTAFPLSTTFEIRVRSRTPKLSPSLPEECVDHRQRPEEADDPCLSG